MSNKETWEIIWAATRAEDIWMFVVALVLWVVCICVYYATGGDKED